jgi:hypothetical protein
VTDVPLTKHRAKQVGHSLNVIAELPRYVDDAAFPVGLRVAAIDAFFIHLRLLIEFLIKKPDRAHPAIHRDDYASGFNLGSVDPALYRSLSSDFDFASQHVVMGCSSRYRWPGGGPCGPGSPGSWPRN